MDNKRKRNKQYYKQIAAKKSKYGALEVGARGFLITCNDGKERKATQETFALLLEYLGDDSHLAQVPPAAIDEDDVEAALKSECDAMTSGSVQRFHAVESGVRNVVFVEIPDSEAQDPAVVAHKILSDIKTSGQKKARFIQRLLPVQLTCKAYLEDIRKALINGDYLKKHFGPDVEPPPTFGIFYKSRHNNSLAFTDLVREIGELVSLTNPLVTVNLSKPQKAILVEVVNKLCCISVVDEYIELRKYNVHEVITSECAKDSKNSANA